MFRLTLPLALVAAFALTACGVKGPLEPPPGAPQAHAAPAQAQSSAVVVPPPSASIAGFHTATSASDMANTATPHADWEKNQQKSSGAAASTTATPVVRPDRPFILDGLL